MIVLFQKLAKALVQAMVGFIIVGVLAGVGQESYFRFLNGDWFLPNQPATVQNAEAGQPVPFEWCRNPRHGAISANLTRTFFKYDETTESFRPVSEYSFNANIEEIEEECQLLAIPASRQPQDDGRYYFVTDISWVENGYDKKISYRSNAYDLDATPESLINRIKVLELEIERLEKRLQELNRGNSTNQQSNNTNPTSESSENPNVAQSSPPPENQNQPSEPDTPPQTPQNGGVVQETVRDTRGFVQRVFDDVRNVLPF